MVTNWIAGDYGSDTEKLKRAKKRVKSLQSIGLMEEMNNSVKLIFNSLNLSPPTAIPFKNSFDSFTKDNQAMELIQKEPITQEIDTLLNELTILDRKLYKYIVKIFNRRKYSKLFFQLIKWKLSLK